MATKTEEVQTLEGLGSYNLEIGSNVIKVVVTAENGQEREIQITVNRKQSQDASINNVGVKGYTLSHASDNIYSVEVAYNVESIEIENISTTGATVTGIGVKENLVFGNNDYEVEVTSQDGTVTNKYIIRIIKNEDTTNTLKSLTLTDCSLTPEFNSETTNYTCTVENSVTATTVTAEATSEVATVSGTGDKSLIVGDNTVEVIVTSQSGVDRIYTVVITRKPNSDASLKTLEVTGQALTPTFDKDVLSYTLSVPYSIDNITLTGTPTASVSTVEGLGTKVLTIGENAFDVIVTAEDGTIRTYTITVTRQQDTDTSLKSISVTGQTIVKVDENHYTLTVANDITSAEVNAEATSSVAIVTGTGTKTLSVGSNVVKVTVTAQNGDVSVYEIDITRLASSDATLKSLTVSSGTLSPTFESGITSYTVTVPYSVTSITVNVEVNNSEASVEGTGTKSLSLGTNTASIKVTAGDGTTKTYAVTVTRKASSDATLKSLTVSSGTLSPTFESGTTSYTLTVPYSVTSLTVTGTVNNSEASYTVSGNTGLVVGTNTVTVKVTAGDGTEKTYTITVTREKDTDATLKSLSVTGYSLTPTFDSETTSYTLELEASSVEITAEANSSVAASVSGIGTKTLSWGTNTASVIVTAQDGTVKTYIITITNQQPTAPVIIGGSSSWVSTAPMIKVSTAGTAVSGVKHYEYYKSTSSTAPTNATLSSGTVSNGTTATGTTSGNLTVSDEGITYVWYRTVSTNGFKSTWTSSPQVIYLDTDAAKLTGFAKIIYDANTLVAANPTLTTSSNNTSDASGLYKSIATNSGNSTYYFRGNVTNNYVEFAGFTWRIVRINDDGTIRLIMQDGINDNTKYVFNSTHDMYYSNSNIKSQLKTWYTANITNKEYSDYVSIGDYFCEQSKVINSTSWTAGSASPIVYFKYTPNFKCETDGNGYGIVNSSIGLITYDEVAYAGGYGFKENDNYYLNNGTDYWTMSPTALYNEIAYNWRIRSVGSLYYYSVNSDLALHPVINLKADIQMVGSGTETDPWILDTPSALNERILSDNTLITAEPTLTTSSNNTDDASGLYKSTATNDGSATYYFRGNVQNNYVEFADQIWRIVRINEDGTIRLVKQSVIAYSGYKFNTSDTVKKYMYYSNSDTAKTTLDSWYQTNIVDKEYSSHVATGDYFCEQGKVVSSDSYLASITGTVTYPNYTPNFKCEADANGYGIVNSSIGLLTYDEVAFAGGYPFKENTDYYMYYDGSYYDRYQWLMSPAGYSGVANIWTIYGEGDLYNYFGTSSGLALRPVINLKANTLATGTGTSTNPYTIIPSSSVVLKDTILENNTLITTEPTLTTSSNNTSDASGLYSSTNTNNGNTTYYFRGNVENNYVDFAGFTWRIVRINEDGTIRLIMDTGINNNANYAFNTSYLNNSSFMYYSYSSTAKTQLTNWYTTNIDEAGYSDKVATGSYFCEQARVASSSSFTNMTVYSSYTPRFSCTTDSNYKGTISSNIGLISYDEAVYAGGYYDQANSDYYLYNGSASWTISTAGYSTAAGGWFINSNGGIRATVISTTYTLRPVINLNADTAVTGTGTSSDHYIVQ